MSILDPALLGITVKAASFLWEQAAKFRVARDKLEQTELSLDELEKQPARELIQKVLELRAYSLELFQGRNVYETEFTSLLNYLNNGIEESREIYFIPQIQTIQSQLKTIANYRSELENGYANLMAHGFKMNGEFGEDYKNAIITLTEHPRVLFEEGNDENWRDKGPVNDSLFRIRSILSLNRQKWAEEEAFSKRASDLISDLDAAYKEFRTNGWLLDENIQKSYQEAKDILLLSGGVQRQQATKYIANAKQTLIELQAALAQEKTKLKQLEEERRQKEEATKIQAEQQKLADVIQEKRVRSLLFLISMFIGIPVLLFLLGLALLQRQFSIVSEAEILNITIPFLHIPYAVILWSGLGSIASMLNWVNLYKEERFLSSWEMLRWALTRPLTGIVMGIVIYLAVYAGLLISIGRAPGELSQTNYFLISLLAFVGGFSDKVQRALIRLVIGKIDFTMPEDPYKDPKGT